MFSSKNSKFFLRLGAVLTELERIYKGNFGFLWYNSISSNEGGYVRVIVGSSSGINGNEVKNAWFSI